MRGAKRDWSATPYLAKDYLTPDEALKRTGFTTSVVERLISEGYLAETIAPVNNTGFRIHAREVVRFQREYISEPELRRVRKYRFAFETEIRKRGVVPAIKSADISLNIYRRQDVFPVDLN
ncbi:hypothetical protein [Pararhizobium sp. PWRC1-1]|uniref:hypothetical protein n=1 Tax=Pararhizobium sp. PWRC1-1 TaxID=2804566 RepID=UPI003CF3B9F8